MEGSVRWALVQKAREHNQKQERNGTMKTITKVMTTVVFAVGLLGIHNALAEPDYDAKTVETVGGKVLSVEKTTPAKNEATGLI
jgi:hypothetical protein